MVFLQSIYAGGCVFAISVQSKEFLVKVLSVEIKLWRLEIFVNFFNNNLYKIFKAQGLLQELQGVHKVML